MSDKSPSICAAPEASPCIGLSLNNYSEGLDSLFKSLDELEVKLNPILSPAYPPEMGEDCAGGNSPIHVDLICMNDRLSILSAFVRQIQDRVTL
jgi:hypothetical protein